MNIELSDVCFSINSYVAFNKLNFALQEKKKMVIYYESGSGATLLCKLVCGLEVPTSGKVLVFGKESKPNNGDITFFPKKQLFFENKSAYANLLWAAKVTNQNCHKNNILLLLSKYSIKPHEKPKNMDNLSRLKLAIARAKMFEKSVVVADDIFVELSRIERNIAQKLFFDFVKNKTVVFLSSDLTFAPKNFVKKCLVFGKIFDVPSRPCDAQVFFSRRIAFPDEKCIKAKFDIERSCFESCEKVFSISVRQIELLKEKLIEEVYLFFDASDSVVSAFDAMDGQKLW